MLLAKWVIINLELNLKAVKFLFKIYGTHRFAMK